MWGLMDLLGHNGELIKDMNLVSARIRDLKKKAGIFAAIFKRFSGQQLNLPLFESDSYGQK